MKKIALVTDVAFWQVGLGKNAGIRELYYFLLEHSQLTLYYLGEKTCPLSGPCFHKDDKQSQLAAYLEKEQFDLIIVEYLHLHWVADLGIKAPIYLHAHDVLSERAAAFQAYDREGAFPPQSVEIECFRKFTKVILAQKEEIEKVSLWIGIERLLLCQHPVVPEAEIPFREEVETIGFLGSPAWPNIDGIHWFHDVVMPLLGDLEKKCIVHGSFLLSPLTIFFPRLSMGQSFPSLGDYYKSVDIAINPVLYGSGLKIKTIEAIAYGIPLVTTSAGAQGLRDENGRSFLLADTASEFASAIRQLADSSALRRQLSANARAFAKQHLTPEACFSVLLEDL